MMLADYKLLIKGSKQLCKGNVAISSVCPRMNKHDITVQDFNIKLQNLAEKEKCQYIQNDLNFRYANRQPDMQVFSDKIFRLNNSGVRRFLKNCDIPLVENSKQEASSDKSREPNRRRTHDSTYSKIEVDYTYRHTPADGMHRTLDAQTHRYSVHARKDVCC